MKLIWLEEKKKANKEVKEKLIECADSYFNLAIPKDHPKCSTTYLGMAICNLALTYKVTKEKRYLEESIRFMDGVCNYKTWGNAHLVNVDLSASFILFGLSLAYNYLAFDLTEEKRAYYYDTICEHAQIIYDYKVNNLGKGWPTNYWQNHNWINHTALLLSGYILDNELFIREALNNFAIVFANMPIDGSNYEGITYHRYGGMWLFIAAWLIKELGYKDYFKESLYLKNTFYFRLYSSDSTLFKQLNFGDCHDRFSSHAIFTYFLTAKMYNDGYAKWYGDYILKYQYYREQTLSHVKPGVMPEMWLCYLSYPNNIKSKDIKELPLRRYFPDLGYFVIRDSWLKDSTVFAIKASYPGGNRQWCNAFTKFKNPLNIMALSHHHPDHLSYLLTKGVSYLVIDDGYNRNIGPLCHNSLLVDGKLLDQMDVNDTYLASYKKRHLEFNDYNPLNYGAFFKNYLESKEVLSFTSDATNLYPLDLNLSSVRREVILKNNLDYIIFLDVFSSSQEHIYESHINSDYYPIKKANLSYYKGIDAKLYHYTFAKENLVVRADDILVKSIMTTQEPDNYTKTMLRGRSYLIKAKDSVIYEILSTKNLEVVKYSNYLLINNEAKLYFTLDKDQTDAIALFTLNKKAILIDGSYLKINDKYLVKEKQKANYLVEVEDELFK